MWEINLNFIVPWLDEQDDETIAHIFAALEILEREGPGLGRPLVDTLSGTTIKNLKELRPASPSQTEIRIIFAFDHSRKAIMLLGGDKAKGKSGDAWNRWYRKAIPKAEKVFLAHLAKTGNEHERP